MSQQILCEVSNCHFNEEGRRCGADEIFVVSHKGDTANSSTETDCKTFRPQHEL